MKKFESKFLTPKRKKIIRIVSLCVLAAVMLLVTIICIPLVKMLSSEEGRQGLEKLVDENFMLGLSVYLLLQVLQVVVALIPGGVIQILGGVLFGKFMGTFWCVLGILLGTIVVFMTVRKFGMPVVEAFIDQKGIKRFEFLNNSKKLEACSVYSLPDTRRSQRRFNLYSTAYEDKADEFLYPFHAWTASGDNTFHCFRGYSE